MKFFPCFNKLFESWHYQKNLFDPSARSSPSLDKYESLVKSLLPHESCLFFHLYYFIQLCKIENCMTEAPPPPLSVKLLKKNILIFIYARSQLIKAYRACY